MARNYAHRTIEAAKVAANLLPIGNIPATESQARPLTVLEPAQQREVWQRAVDTAPGGRVTRNLEFSPMGEKFPLPSTERQARPLTALEPAQQREACSDFAERAC